jgi:DNA-binding MarR family transcriptional regulator
MTKSSIARPSLTDADYQTLAAFRYELRRFTRFSENAAKSAGLTPQQHQALLAIRSMSGSGTSIGDLAEFLMLQPHSASELIDRLALLDLVSRVPAKHDRRSVTLNLTSKAEAILASLVVTHRDELRKMRPLLIELLKKLE